MANNCKSCAYCRKLKIFTRVVNDKSITSDYSQQVRTLCCDLGVGTVKEVRQNGSCSKYKKRE